MRGIQTWVAAGMAAGMGWLAIGAGVAEAHGRDYLVTQPYYTAKRGEFEVEVWTDFKMPKLDDAGTYNFKQQYEVEYGVTNHFQVAAYEIVKWDRTDDFEVDAYKIETKYRFAEEGQWPVDVALYGEYENPNGRADTEPQELEGKLILSRDFGPLNLTGNMILQKRLQSGHHVELSYALGASYPIAPTARVGLELTETLGDVQEEFGFRRADHELYLVPGVYVNLTKDLRLLAGVAVGLTRGSDDVQFRSILEWEF